jgi:predicted RNA-binding protein with PUA-like domain
MATYLLKTEPATYSYADLARDKRTVWDGVKSALALKYLREIRKGDTLLIYHTGSERSVIGLAKATSDPYPDPELDDEKRTVVDLRAWKKLKRPVPILAFRGDPVLSKTELVRLSRLSVMQLTEPQLKRVLKLGGL